MPSHRLHQAPQHRLPQARAIQELDARVRGRRRHQRPAQLRPRAVHRRVGAEQLHPAVRPTGVRVHDPPRQLHQFPDMPHQQDRSEALRRRHVQRVPDEVGTGHAGQIRRDGRPLQERSGIVPRRQDQAVRSQGPGLTDLHPHGVDQGPFAHGLHDPRGPQDRDPAHDPQMGIEGPRRQTLPLRDADLHRQAARVSGGGAFGVHRLPDLTPGARVHCRRPHGLIQSGQRDPSHARTAVDRDPVPLRAAHRRADVTAVRHVGIVPGVLDHRGPGRLSVQGQPVQIRLHVHAPRRPQTHRHRPLSGQQETRRPRRRHRRAGPGGQAAAQETLSAADVPFKHAPVPPGPGPPVPPPAPRSGRSSPADGGTRTRYSS